MISMTRYTHWLDQLASHMQSSLVWLAVCMIYCNRMWIQNPSPSEVSVIVGDRVILSWWCVVVLGGEKVVACILCCNKDTLKNVCL